MTRMLAAYILVSLCVSVAVWATEKTVPAKAPAATKNVTLRGHFDNCRLRFTKDKAGHVAFIGGSITEMNGYRPMVCEDLQKTFPQTKFTFTDAGISSTCSTTGAFRLQRDVLSKGPVDLFFVEFAVNDDQDAAHTRAECIRGMEGIIRQARTHNPNCDIVVTYFVNPGMLAQLQAGKEPLPMAAHEAVLEHLGISRIHLAREVARRISAGALTWKTFGGTHPKPAGNRIAADMIAQLFGQAWAKPLTDSAKPKPHPMPKKLLDPCSYVRGRLVDVKRAKTDKAWQVHTPDWKKLKGNCRTRFRKDILLTADKPGATLTLTFTGKGVGAYVLAGPDAGVVEARVDDGPARKINLYHRYSRGLHYPRTVMFADDLADGEHTLTLRIVDRPAWPKTPGGTTARILAFAVNGELRVVSGKK